MQVYFLPGRKGMFVTAHQLKPLKRQTSPDWMLKIMEILDAVGAGEALLLLRGREKQRPRPQVAQDDIHVELLLWRRFKVDEAFPDRSGRNLSR